MAMLKVTRTVLKLGALGLGMVHHRSAQLPQHPNNPVKPRSVVEPPEDAVLEHRSGQLNIDDPLEQDVGSPSERLNEVPNGAKRR